MFTNDDDINNYQQPNPYNRGVPSVSGSMQFPATNQIYPNAFFDPDVFSISNNQPTQQFSKGGQVKSWAEYLRRQGRGGDDTLAHINSGEAALLKALGGSGTRNPRTGLPEFRSKFWRTVGKVVAPLVGSFLGGPAGAMGLSALQGLSERGKGNKLKGALGGAGKGALYAALAPMAGEVMGVNSAGLVGRGLGMNSPSLLAQLGMASAPQIGGGLGLFGNGVGNTGVVSQYLKGSPKSTAEGSSGLLGKNSLLDAGLLAIALGGTLGRKEKAPKEAESFQTFMQRNQVPERPEDRLFNVKPFARNYRLMDENYRPGYDPEWLYFEDSNPRAQRYSQGGYISGESNGQADRVPALLSDGEFVTKAPVIAALGGGNNRAGAKIFSHFQDFIMDNSPNGYFPRNKIKSIGQFFEREIKNAV